MFSALKHHRFTFVDESLDLAAVAGEIAAEYLVPHLEEDLIHTQRVVLGNLLCRIE